MEKFCGIIVFFSVFQLAGMLDFHQLPTLQRDHLVYTCNFLTTTIGWGRVC